MNALVDYPSRLGKLVRLLSTDKDSEAIAAVRAIGRLLHASGCDFHDLADVLERIDLRPRAETSELLSRARWLRDFGALTGAQLDFICTAIRILTRGGTLSAKQLKWLVDLFDLRAA